MCVLYVNRERELQDIAEKKGNTDGLFTAYALYFHSVASALRFLLNGGHLTLKGDLGDVNDLLHRLKLDEPEKKFDRIYLSNIPDYTSLFYAFVESMPLLKVNPKKIDRSFLKCNILLNCSFWNDYSDYVYASKVEL